MKRLVLIALMIAAAMGCKKENDSTTPTDLLGTWRLVGFVENGTLREATPSEKECPECFTMRFMENNKLTIRLDGNSIEWNTYSVQGNEIYIKLGEITKVGDFGKDPLLVQEIFFTHKRIKYTNREIEVWYSKEGKENEDYLLFYKK
jgi:lipoprotein